MANTVGLKSVGSLFNGKEHFYIPSYQRGYRWRRKQAEDLLADLYSFTKNDNGDFYCLQPVIVKPILVGDERRKVLGELADDPDHNLWELVDGQQRLTSLYILLKAAEPVTGVDVGKRYEIIPYTLHYESRPEFLEEIEKADKDTEFLPQAHNIDSAHAHSVYRIMKDWFGGRGRRLSMLYNGGEGEKKFAVADSILKLVTANTKKDVVNMIWYQLDPKSETDTIQEFININNGKIPLLDSELVKALFLQRRKEDGGGKLAEEVAMKRAMQWEIMENRLQANDFWGFISPDDTKNEDRMGALLEMIYLSENPGVKIEKGDVFRHFYEYFEGKQEDSLEKALETKWDSIVDAFHALEDWYESPLYYNYIGYLVASGEKNLISEIYTVYRRILDGKGAEGVAGETPPEETDGAETDFRSWLEKRIKSTLSKVVVKKEIIKKDNDAEAEEVYKIECPYSNANRGLLRNIFKLLNILLLSRQYEAVMNKNEEFINDAGVFRFPFHLYKQQQWDIEHIDSQTSNPLTSKTEQQQWVIGALLDTATDLSAEENNRLADSLEKMGKGEEAGVDWTMLEGKIPDALYDDIIKEKWADAIQLIETSEGTDEENPHMIGNLTLLDAETNRGYKNALFCTKRKYVIEALSKGRYILPATQCVFMKFFDSDPLSVSSRIKWEATDKGKHHDFIYDNLKEFLQDAK